MKNNKNVFVPTMFSDKSDQNSFAAVPKQMAKLPNEGQGDKAGTSLFGANLPKTQSGPKKQPEQKGNLLSSFGAQKNTLQQQKNIVTAPVQSHIVENTKPKVPKQGKTQTILQGTNQSRAQTSKNPLSKFDQGYQTKGKLDILNAYYQMCEQPNQVNAQLIINLSKQINLILKHKPQNYRQQTIGRINFSELQSINQPKSTQIKSFWLNSILKFVKTHPYCSFDGALELCRFHIKQNILLYFPKGQFNLQLFNQNNQQQVENLQILFTKIQVELQRVLDTFISHVAAIIKAIPEKLANKFLNSSEIVQNFMSGFRQMYNLDYEIGHTSLVHQHISLNLVNILLNIYNKSPNIFTKQFVANLFKFSDSHLIQISRNLNMSEMINKQRQISVQITRKLINLLNLLLLQLPYQFSNIDQNLLKIIINAKSEYLQPFKWIFSLKETKRPQLNFGRTDPERLRQITQFNRYFLISGKEWLPLLLTMIQNKKKDKYLSINQLYKDVIFYLVCSIIQQNAVEFWSDSEQYQKIYDFIAQLYEDMQKSQHFSKLYDISLGKICRIIICSLGKQTSKINQSAIQQLTASLNSDSIMHQLSNSSFQNRSSYLNLSAIAYEHFAANIINVPNLTKQKLFSQIIFNLVSLSQNNQFPFYSIFHQIQSQIQIKYHYDDVKLVVHQLILRMLSDNPQLLKTFSSVPYFSSSFSQLQQQIQKQSKPQLQFLWMCTLEYSIKCQDFYYLQVFSQNNNIKLPPQHQPLSRSLDTLTKILTNKKTQNIVIQLLSSQSIYGNQKIKQILNFSTLNLTNIKSMIRHVQQFYRLKLNKMGWIGKVCEKCIQGKVRSFGMEVVGHWANIAVLALHQKFYDKSIQRTNSNIVQLYSIKVPQLNNHSDQLLDFICLALSVEQDNLNLNNNSNNSGLGDRIFYNIFYVSQKYEYLESALKLLQILAITYLKNKQFLYLSERMKRFLSVFQTSQYKYTYKNTNNMNTCSLFSQKSIPSFTIQLGNKKCITIPAALSYIICAPLYTTTTNNTWSIKQKQIQSVCMSIFGLLLTSNNNGSSNYAYLYDRLSELDMNVYTQYYINEPHLQYTSTKEKFITFIKQQLRPSTSTSTNTNSITNTNTNNHTTNSNSSSNGNGNECNGVLKWYQQSILYSQYIDIHTCAHLTDPSTIQHIHQRIKHEQQHGDTIRDNTRRLISNNLGITTFTTSSSNVVMGISDRELAAYSRYAVHLAYMLSNNNNNTNSNSNNNNSNKVSDGELQKHLANMLDLLVTKSQNLYPSNPYTIPIFSNILKTLRVLQTSCNNNTNINTNTNTTNTNTTNTNSRPALRVYSACIRKYLGFILSPIHIKISDDIQYREQYINTVVLVLACRDYLHHHLYAQVLREHTSIITILSKFIRECAYHTHLYILLFYALTFYTQLIDNGDGDKQIVREAYNIVEETHNNNNTHNAHNTNDINMVALMMLFKQEIPSAFSRGDTTTVHEQLLSPFSHNHQSSHTTNNNNNGNGNNAPLALLLSASSNTRGGRYLKQCLSVSVSTPIQFICVCNYIYTCLSTPHAYDQTSTVQIIPSVIQYLLNTLNTNNMNVNTTINGGGWWRRVCYTKAWCSNILYLILSSSYTHTPNRQAMRGIIQTLCDVLINDHNLLAFLGELLSVYTNNNLRWPYKHTHSHIHNTHMNNMNSRMGLLQKQLLLSLLKLYSSVVANLKCTGSDGGAVGKLCVSMVGVLPYILGGDGKLKNVGVQVGSDYEQVLGRCRINNNNGINGINGIGFPITNTNAVNTTNKNSNGNGNGISILSVIHEHVNMLILQKIMLINLATYKNPQLILHSYNYQQVISVFQYVSNKIKELKNNQKYEELLQKITKQNYFNYRMNTNLYYLNFLEQSPKEQLQVYNSIAQISISCIVSLKFNMQMHKDYRVFWANAQKSMRNAVKNAGFYGFDVKGYVDMGGFEDRSQYGTSTYNRMSQRI